MDEWKPFWKPGADLGMPDPIKLIDWTTEHQTQKSAAKGTAINCFLKWLEFKTQEHREVAMNILCNHATPEWWAMGYIHSLWIDGLRGEQVKTEVGALRGAFKAMGWGHCPCWDSWQVTTALNSCGRTVRELRAHMAEKIRMEKYDMNFEALYTMRQKMVPSEDVFSSNPNKKVAYEVILYLLAYVLFDLGVRGGNMADTGKRGSGRGKSETKRTTSKNRKDEDTGENPNKAWTVEEEEKFIAIRHESQARDWTYFVPNEGEELRPIAGHQLADYWRKNPGGWPVKGEVIFPTSKTGNGSRTVVQPVKFGQASPVEKAEFDLLLNFFKWSAFENPTQVVFLRRAIPETSIYGHSIRGQPKRIRMRDLATAVKTVAVEAGVGHNHISPIGFRKGHVSTNAALGQLEEQRRLAEELRRIKERGHQWAAESQVPQTHYLHAGPDAGPYARVQSWAEAIKVGGGFRSWRERQGVEVGLDLEAQKKWRPS